VTVQKMEPERLFSFTWHPYAVDPDQPLITDLFLEGSPLRR